MTPSGQPAQYALPLLKLISHILTPLSTALIISTLSFLDCSHYYFSIRCFIQIPLEYSLPNLHPLTKVIIALPHLLYSLAFEQLNVFFGQDQLRTSSPSSDHHAATIEIPL
jgi:hypothetical protein